MAAFFERLEPEHIAFIEKQHMFFVASATDGAHPNLSPKGYEALTVLGPDRLVYVDWPGSGNQTATHVAEHGRITLMFCSFEGGTTILRVYGKGQVIARHSDEFAELAGVLGDTVGSHTRQLIAITVQRVQTSCGYAVPLFEYRGQRETLSKYYDKKHAEVDWEAYLTEHTAPQAPIVR
ncbi:MAG: pyridoxamine 5'-phosphate oxidase family protein [Deltaproteobacteria bacterium]|nr:pyridoxamine 5'-phosphate oxidase family protein [Deltaproteobacteria bacterium]MBI3387328.1 pyridoxamine 5'-phosphate oxidase family protein [Deltaproteobacteria bacterium]